MSLQTIAVSFLLIFSSVAFANSTDGLPSLSCEVSKQKLVFDGEVAEAVGDPEKTPMSFQGTEDVGLITFTASVELYMYVDGKAHIMVAGFPMNYSGRTCEKGQVAFVSVKDQVTGTLTQIPDDPISGLAGNTYSCVGENPLSLVGTSLVGDNPDEFVKYTVTCKNAEAK